MKINTSDQAIWLIGDPHMGRDFKNGTPLHRRGEREAMQLAQFKEELATPDVDMVVMVGDLFDKPFVPLEVINTVAFAIKDAAEARPDVLFFMMAGNHDKSRQLNVRGAWELLELAVGWIDNVTFVNEPMVTCGIGMFPWEWVGTAAMQVEYAPAGRVEAAIGHWDCVDFGHADHMVPVKELRAKYGEDVNFYTGHDHGEGEVEVNGARVMKTGSMQPYTHAEDAEGDLYVTLSVDEALAQADELKNKCVRILLQPGEDMPDIDCLQLTQKRADVEAEEIDMAEVGIGSFNLGETLESEFNDNEVPEPVRIFIKEKMGAVA